MRRHLARAMALAALLALAGCGASPQPPSSAGLAMRVDVATGPMEALPLLMGVGRGPLALVWRPKTTAAALEDLRDGAVALAVLPPAAVDAAPAGLVVIERLASNTDVRLLARSGPVLFHWKDVSGATVVATAGTRRAFQAALGSYPKIVKDPPLVVSGTVRSFLRGTGDFLLAHEPEASLLTSSGRANPAQDMAAETGPHAAAVLVTTPSVLARWPRLMRFVVFSLWRNALALRRDAVGGLAVRLEAALPGTPPQVLSTALTRVRRLGVVPTDPRVVPPSGSRLGTVFPGTDWTGFFAAVDDRLAEAALRTVY